MRKHGRCVSCAGDSGGAISDVDEGGHWGEVGFDSRETPVVEEEAVYHGGVLEGRLGESGEEELFVGA